MALLDTLAQGRQVDRRQDRRLHRGAALLPRLRPGVVPEPDGAVGAAAGADRSALSGAMARERQRAELRRVRQGVRLQEGPADVSGKLLPGVVSDEGGQACKPPPLDSRRRNGSGDPGNRHGIESDAAEMPCRGPSSRELTFLLFCRRVKEQTRSFKIAALRARKMFARKRRNLIPQLPNCRKSSRN